MTRAIRIGMLAATLLRREARRNPEAYDDLEESITDVRNGNENRFYYPKGVLQSPEKAFKDDFVTINVLAHDDLLDGHPSGTVLVQGMIQKVGTGIELEENMLIFGDEVAASIRVNILSGAYQGKRLSSVIGSGFGSYDPRLGPASARQAFGDDQVIIEINPVTNQFKDYASAKRWLQENN